MCYLGKRSHIPVQKYSVTRRSPSFTAVSKNIYMARIIRKVLLQSEPCQALGREAHPVIILVGS